MLTRLWHWLRDTLADARNHPHTGHYTYTDKDGNTRWIHGSGGR